jgi:ComF family protein
VRELELVDEKFVFPVYSGWHFDEKIETVIHALKYDKHFSIGPFLGKKIAGNAEKLGLEFDGSLLVPVPLHAKRFKERGFNQSERIVQGMLMQNNKASLSICLKRVVYTQSQAVLSQTERLKNVFNAFSVEMNDKENLKNKRIYLIDDVLTTGATMCECCKVLYRAGATNIAGLTIATAR